MNRISWYTFLGLQTYIVASLSVATHCSAQGLPLGWKKHLITQQGHCNTAVAIDSNGDAALDVIASFNGRVSLFTAPDWREIILHRFFGQDGVPSSQG